MYKVSTDITLHQMAKLKTVQVEGVADGKVYVARELYVCLHLCLRPSIFVQTIKIHCMSGVRLHSFLPCLVQSITPLFTDEFHYNLALVFSIMNRCSISKICSNKSKVKIILQGQMLKLVNSLFAK